MALFTYVKTFTTSCPGELIDAINANGLISPTLVQITNEGGPGDSTFYFDASLSGAEETELDNTLAGWTCPPNPPGDYSQGGVGSVQLKWKFDNSTTSSDPGSGLFRIDNANPASATEMYINDEDEKGVDASTLLTAFKSGDQVYIQELEDASKYMLVTVTSVTDNTGWFTITFNVNDTGALFDDGKECGVVLMYSSTPGGTLKQSFHAHNSTTTQTLTTTFVTAIIGTDIRSDAIYSNTNGEVTVNKTANFEVTYDVSGNSTGARSEMECVLQINSVDVPGSFSYGYHRNSTQGKNTPSCTKLVALTSGDVVRVRIRETSGGVVTLANSCRLTIREID